MGAIECESFLNKSILPIDGSVIGTTTPCKSGPGSNGNERVLYAPSSPELEPLRQM